MINLSEYEMTQKDLNDLIAACIVWVDGINPTPGSPADKVKTILERCRKKPEDKRTVQ